MIRDVRVNGRKLDISSIFCSIRWRESRFYIQYFFLEEEYRGKGYFKKLLSTVKNIGKRRRIKIFYLVPTDGTVYAIYKKYGFVGDMELMRLEI